MSGRQPAGLRMSRVIIGTAGHVDHGKTRLIQALTGVNTDRLPEERARGLTTEPGFAPLDFPDGLQAGIVDVPGHEKYLRHMLRGAGGVDLVLLTVAADEGIMPQTEEHLEILELLGISGGLTVLTKCDLVDLPRLDTVRRQVLTRLRGTFLEGGPLLPVSAVTGQGLPELRQVLHRLVLASPPRSAERPLRLPLDRVFTVEGFGLVVTGTLLEGALRRGDPVELSPSGRQARVRGLQIFGREVEEALAGQRTAVNLTGLRKEALRRGDVLCAPGLLPASSLLDAEVRILPGVRRPLVSGTQVQLFHYAAQRTARVVLLDRDTLEPGQRAFAQLRLSEPLGTVAGDRFILRIPSPAETVGGGAVLDPCPGKHRRRDMEVLEALAIWAEGSPAGRLLLEICRLGGSLPDRAALAALWPGEPLEPLLKELTASGKLLEPLPGRYLAASVWGKLRDRSLRVVGAYHREKPLLAGIPEPELRQKAGLSPELLELLVSQGALRRLGNRYALPAFQVRFTPRQLSIRRTVLSLCAAQGQHAPCPGDLEARFPAQEREDCRQVLESLLVEGRLHLLPAGILCHGKDLARYRRILEGWLRNHDILTLAQYRDLLGCSRDYALAVLEHFDRSGLTRRTAGGRVLCEGAERR